jgi:diaminohydroxyphosphoribosylaminopyrimidine deaminase/5-amino-6-(5-phosphoribosylamino)uracil reductase
VTFVRLEETNFLEGLLHHLYDHHIQSVIIEGGTQILKCFIEKRWWDEARIFISPQKFKAGIAAPHLTGTLKNELKLKSDTLRILVPISPIPESFYNKE